jgi:protein-disulfide isomerase
MCRRILFAAGLFLAFTPVFAAYAAVTPTAAPAAAAAAATTTTAAPPAPVSTFSDAQRAEIEGIIKDYITQKNPEVLMEAMQELQKREAADSAAKTKAAVASDHAKLFEDPTTPIGGNPKGDVTVVEFFDYQCGYCKMAEPNIEKLLKEDKNVKLIYKDFPILGPMSVTAAKAALAAARQDKYIKFHDALMAQKGHLDEDLIYKVAKESGLDVEKLKKDMNDEVIDKAVETNVALGTEIGARGTPTFIIADQVYPGAMEYDQLKKAVDDARAAAKKP